MVGGLALYHLQHLGGRRGWWKFRVDDDYHRIAQDSTDCGDGERGRSADTMTAPLLNFEEGPLGREVTEGRPIV